MKTSSGLVFATVMLMNTATVSAETHVVNAEGIRFSPEVLIIKPGDTVRWNTMTVHSVGAVEGYIPENAVGWESDVGENFQMTFTQEGIYIYRCKPHQRLAMAGAIIVGKPSNLDDIKSKSPDKFIANIVNQAINKAESLD